MTRYKKILELLEEPDDSKAYDKAVKRKHKFVPFEASVKRLKTLRKSKD